MTSGGSLANLQALAVARNAKLDVQRRGLVGLTRRPVLFASQSAHTSIEKAAMVLGLGAHAVIPVEVDQHSHLIPAQLEAAIQAAESRGDQPFCVVATAGTTVTGSIDPLGESGKIAKAHQLWFHVDAAYGGALVFSVRHREKLAGIELADSITFNPQKWLYVTKACATVLFRDVALLGSKFRTAAPYMNWSNDLPNLGELSVQGTRHADILKLWLTLNHFGEQGCASLVDESLHLTQHFVDCIRRREYLEVVAEPDMNIVCFRVRRGAITSQDPDLWTVALQEHLHRNIRAFISLPHYQGSRCFKAVLLNPYMETSDIDRIFAEIDSFFHVHKSA